MFFGGFEQIFRKRFDVVLRVAGAQNDIIGNIGEAVNVQNNNIQAFFFFQGSNEFGNFIRIKYFQRDTSMRMGFIFSLLHKFCPGLCAFAHLRLCAFY